MRDSQIAPLTADKYRWLVLNRTLAHVTLMYLALCLSKKPKTAAVAVQEALGLQATTGRTKLALELRTLHTPKSTSRAGAAC